MANVPPYHTDFEEHTQRSVGMCITATMIVRMGGSYFRTTVGPARGVNPNVRSALS